MPFIHQGQVCMNTRKVYVARSVHDDFVAQLAAKAAALKQGDPTDPAVVVGPLINGRAVAATMASIRDALDRGATLVTGGTAEGAVVAPTIITHAPDDALCTTGRDEFGPLLVVEAFDDEEAALAKAQDTPYGLSAAIHPRSCPRAGDGAALQRRHRPYQCADHGQRGGAARRRGQGLGLGPVGTLCGRGLTEVRLTTLSTAPGMYPF